MSLKTRTTENRDDITAFFRSTRGVAVGSVILLGCIVVFVGGAIFGWF